MHMRVFVAGATGALGAPLVRALVARGHEVSGLTRSEGRARSIVAAGAHPVIADALDRDGLMRAVRSVQPTHIVHLLTALPDLPRRVGDLRATNRVRTIGTANLVAAARAVGAGRFVAESFAFVYGLHPAVDRCREEDVLAPPADSGSWAPVVEALRTLEAHVQQASTDSGMEAIILRYGAFYGPQVGSTRRMFDLLQRRWLPTAPASGLMSFVHIDDAVSATVLALERPDAGGVYNVADGSPASMTTSVELAARELGAPPPRRLPGWVLRLLAPGPAAMANARVVLDTTRITNELGWRPRYPDLAVGLPPVIAQWRSQHRPVAA